MNGLDQMDRPTQLKVLKGGNLREMGKEDSVEGVCEVIVELLDLLVSPHGLVALYGAGLGCP